MKTLKYVMLLCAVCTLAVINIDTAQAKKRKIPKVYMFGFSASFNDSTIYLTDIQEVDSAWIDDKSHFLQGRGIYAQQLKDYLTSAIQQPNRICMVMYSETLKEIEKQYVKMKRLYTKKSKMPYDIHYLDETMFHFEKIQLYFDEEDVM